MEPEPHVVDLLLDAATRELGEGGIDGFRLRKVAARAEVSPGTLTHYFPTSRDLLEAVIDAFQQRAWALWSEHDWSLGAAGIDALVTDLFVLCCANRETIRARFFLTARDGRLSAPNFRNYLAPFLSGLGHRHGVDKRLMGHSVVLLAMRYAIHPEDELRLICGTDDTERAHEAVCKHLCALASSAAW